VCFPSAVLKNRAVGNRTYRKKQASVSFTQKPVVKSEAIMKVG